MIIETGELPDNPFPGLRPFQFKESKLFFGRRELSEELLSRLSETRFLAVVGTSGSGKSSLVRAGLLPALCGGLMGEAGSDWRVAVLRPGNSPIDELARVLNDPTVLGLTIDEDEETQQIIIDSTLRRGSLGLVEIVRQANLPDGENLLIVVDQFEELFRYEGTSSKSPLVKRSLSSASKSQPMSEVEVSNNGKGLHPSDAEKYGDEAAAFVKLLLEATRQDKVPIFVVITMRSDYLGNCARFWGLPEAINEGQYLVPRLTREQQRQAITGPLKIYGAEITARLVNQLLNDMGDDADQLPLLQHALMRTWKKARSGPDGKKSLDLSHYQEIGGMAEALSRHADVAYDELSDEQKKIAEKLFKCLTVKAPEGQEIRRPTTLKEICEIIDEKEKDVTDVIKVFRRRGRCFLMPPANEPLKPESQIDISHESLIRCWERLKNWVDEEAVSASTYRRLAETAMLHKEDLAELLRAREAHFVLEWWELHHPNQAWAKRYHDADFATVTDFLEKIREQRDKELADEKKQQRKEIRRKFIKILTATFILAFLVVIIAAIGVWRQSKVANEQRDAAEQRGYAALMASAKTSYDQGDYGAANAKLNGLKVYIESDLKKSLKEFVGFEWYYLWNLIHDRNGERTLSGHDGPVYAVAYSDDGQRIATGDDDGIVKIWDASTQRQLNPDLKFSPESAVRSVAFSPNGAKLLAAESADGRVKLWDLSTDQEIALPETPNPHGSIASTVAFSPDGEVIAAGGTTTTDEGIEQGTVSLWNIKSGRKLISDKPVHKDSTNWKRSIFVKSIAFSPANGKVLAIGTDDGVELWSADVGDVGEDITNKIARESIILKGASVYSIAFLPGRENILAIGSANSKVRLLDMSKSEKIDLQAHRKEVSSVVFSKKGDKLATGSYDGSAGVWDVKSLEKVKGWTKVDPKKDDFLSLKTNPQDQSLQFTPTLKGHAGPVNSIAFSPDGETLVSGSDDRTAKIWIAKASRPVENPELEGSQLPLHQDAILSLAFSLDGKTLASGSADGHLRLTSIGKLMQERRKLPEQSPENIQKLIEDNSRPEFYRSQVSSLAVSSHTGKMLAVGNWNGSIRLWDFSKGSEPKDKVESSALQQPGAQGKILSLSFSPDETMLAASNDLETVTVWQLSTHKVLPVSIAGSSVAFSPKDGSLLVTGGADGTVKLWNVKTGKLLETLSAHKKRILSVAFSPDGSMFATGSADNTVVLWNVAERKKLVTLKGHSDAISSLAFSSDSNRLATGSYDGRVKLWDTRDQLWGESPPLELATLKTSNSVLTLTFAPDDRTLIAGCGDGSLWLWRASSDDDVVESKQN